MITALTMAALACLGADGVNSKFVPSGATARIGGYLPMRAEMDGQPDLVKKAPDGLSTPKYGTLKIGDSGWVFILDEPEGQTPKLYVDTNRDGDLTNDPATVWREQKYGELIQHTGSAQVDLGGGQLASLGMYRFDPSDPRRPMLKNTMLYYTDYGHELAFELDGQQFTSFCPPESRIPMWIDRDHNGRRSSKLETVMIDKPFNFTGTTYVLRREGSEFKLERAQEPLPQMPLPPDLSIGKAVIPFEAQALDGTKIDFPKTYAGKLVMLDFWATWCGPCIAELPNVKKAYAAWHDQGFEVLGISFDQPKMEEKVKAFLEQHELSWPQIYEGKGWNTSLGEQYDVTAIPLVLLVDGDNGTILGTSRELRGPGLSDFIGKQLEKKQGKPVVPATAPAEAEKPAAP